MAQTVGIAISVVDIKQFLTSRQSCSACIEVAESLRLTGAVIVRDPRVSASDADAFLDMMERYFAQPFHVKMADTRPQLSYQIGATPPGTERPRNNSHIAHALQPSEKPVSNPSSPAHDPKWRFFWRIGDRPQTTRFPQFNAPQVVPAAFAHQWPSVMNSWGSKLMQVIKAVSEMLALGLHLPMDAISSKLHNGPHLLAPTGIDISLYDNHGSTIAGYHYDLNLLTIHGKCRYPGLYIWTRGGKRLPVVVPDGCLLIQAGIQLEHLTAGTICRGMHEVVVSKGALESAQFARDAGRCTWRVSSTLFAHVRSDASLDPLGQFMHLPAAKNYSGTFAGSQVAQELKAINLSSET